VSSRAWIDPVTNIIRPRSVVLRRDLRGFLIGPWPPHTVQPFIHELTHHWCFHSPVGLALALLRFRARRRSDPLASEEMRLQFDEMLTVDTMLELIRPISEGLALFAEYDMSPGPSVVVTTPITWAAVAMSARSKLLNIAESGDAQEIEGRLLDLRLAHDSLVRKMNFLSRPFTTLDNVYFEGYLLVKRLYWDLSRSVPAFEDTDLFLAYLRSYFFEDYGIFALLAGEDGNPFHRQVPIVERFGARLNDLYRPNLAEDVAIFEDFNNRPPDIERSGGIPGLGLTTNELESGLAIENALLSELQDNPNMESRTRGFLAVQRAWLSRRSLAYVASEPAKVQVLNGLVSAWPDPSDDEYPLVTGIAALADAANTAGNENGWISLVLQPRSGIFAVVVGIGEQVVAIHWPPAMTHPHPDMVAILSHPVCSPEAVRQEHEAMAAWIDGYFRQVPEPLQTYIAQTRQSTQTALRTIADKFLGRWGRDGETALAVLRSANRLWNLFDGDKKMFETFVALGVLRKFDVLLPSFAAAVSARGWDVGQALQRAIQIEAKGVSLVRNDRGVFRWLV
jgi:hypothetical protein